MGSKCIATWGSLGEDCIAIHKCIVTIRLAKSVSRYNCIVIEVAGWLRFVSQYTAVYCDQQGLAAGETALQDTKCIVTG